MVLFSHEIVRGISLLYRANEIDIFYSQQVDFNIYLISSQIKLICLAIAVK